ITLGKVILLRRDIPRRSRVRHSPVRVNCATKRIDPRNWAAFWWDNICFAESEESCNRRNITLRRYAILKCKEDVMWKFFGSALSGNASWFLGKFIEARAYQRKSARNMGPDPTPEDPYVTCLIYLSRSLLCLGYVDQARVHRDEALGIGRQL